MKLEKKNWKIHKQVEIKQHTLNNQEVKEETEKEIRKYHKTNKNENTTYQNLWDAPKPVPRGGFTLPISARDARDPGSVPGSGRSPGVGSARVFNDKHLHLKRKVKVTVAQFCLTLCDPMNCTPPGSSVHGILQARILEWVAIPFSKD